MGTKENPSMSLIEQTYKSKAASIGAVLQGKLDVYFATYLDAETLTLLGVTNYASDQFIIDPPDLSKYKNHLIKNMPDSFSLPRTRWSNIIHDLLGTNMKDGRVHYAISDAYERLREDGADTLQDQFAELLAYQHKLDPDFNLGQPGIRVDYEANLIRGVEGEEVYRMSQSPKIIVEYGPGLAAASKSLTEIPRADTTVFIDTNPYVSTFLKERALLNGLTPPQFIVKAESLGTATSDLLPDFEGRADIVIASRVRPADHEDLIEGINRGQQLLRPGGLYIMQDYVQTEFPSGKPFYPLIKEAVTVFGPPDKFAEFPFKTYGNHFPAFNAVFVKR